MAGQDADTVAPKPAWTLGLLNVSLLPWFAAAVWFLDDTDLWVRLSIAYSALTVGVLGGVRMGFAFARPDTATAHDYGVAILTPLVGWAALVPEPLWGGCILMAAITVSALSDRAAATAGRLPRWYGRLRLQFLPPLLAFLVVVLAKIVSGTG